MKKYNQFILNERLNKPIDIGCVCLHSASNLYLLYLGYLNKVDKNDSNHFVLALNYATDDKIYDGRFFDTYIISRYFTKYHQTIEEYLKDDPSNISKVIESLRNPKYSDKGGVEIQTKNLLVKNMLDRLENNQEIKKYMELDQLGMI